MRLNLTAIRIEMARRNINQLELARLMNVDKSYVSIIMNGKTNTSLPTLGKLSKALELNIGDLVITDED